MNKNSNPPEPTDFADEHVSLRQLNNERLKGLCGRFVENPQANSVEPCSAERGANSFDSSHSVIPDEGKKTPNALQNIQRKFSTSWLNMQQYLGEKKQNRDWDTRFK